MFKNEKSKLVKVTINKVNSCKLLKSYLGFFPRDATGCPKHLIRFKKAGKTSWAYFNTYNRG